MQTSAGTESALIRYKNRPPKIGSSIKEMTYDDILNLYRIKSSAVSFDHE